MGVALGVAYGVLFYVTLTLSLTSKMTPITTSKQTPKATSEATLKTWSFSIPNLDLASDVVFNVENGSLNYFKNSAQSDVKSNVEK